MISKILADIIVLIHLAWIVFMVVGFFLTLRGFFHKAFFDRWVFRTLHLGGIVYVGSLAILREYCPLTILENTLRARYNPELTYPGSFIMYYAQKFIYPDIRPVVILIPTFIIVVFTIVVFILRPPAKIQMLLKEYREDSRG